MKYFVILLGLLSASLFSDSEDPKKKPIEPEAQEEALFLREICTINGELVPGCYPDRADRTIVVEAGDALSFGALKISAKKIIIRGSLKVSDFVLQSEITSVSGNIEAEKIQIQGKRLNLLPSGKIITPNNSSNFQLDVEEARIHGEIQAGPIFWHVPYLILHPKSAVLATDGRIFTEIFANKLGTLKFSKDGHILDYPNRKPAIIVNSGGEIRAGGELKLQGALLKNWRAGIEIEVLATSSTVALAHNTKEWTPDIWYNESNPQWALIDNQPADLHNLNTWAAGQSSRLSIMTEFGNYRRFKNGDMGNAGRIIAGKNLILEVAEVDQYASDLQAGNEIICPNNGHVCKIQLTQISLEAEVSLVPEDVQKQISLYLESAWSSWGNFFDALFGGASALMRVNQTIISPIFERLKNLGEKSLGYVPLVSADNTIEPKICDAKHLDFDNNTMGVSCEGYEHAVVVGQIVAGKKFGGSQEHFVERFQHRRVDGTLAYSQPRNYRIKVVESVQPQDQARNPDQHLTKVKRRIRSKASSAEDWLAESEAQRMRIASQKMGQKLIDFDPAYKNQITAIFPDGLIDTSRFFNSMYDSKIDGETAAVSLHTVDPALQYLLIKSQIEEDFGLGRFEPEDLIANAKNIRARYQLPLGVYPTNDFLKKLPENKPFVWPVDGLNDEGDIERRLFTFYDRFTAALAQGHEKPVIQSPAADIRTSEFHTESPIDIENHLTFRNKGDMRIEVRSIHAGDFTTISETGNTTISALGYCEHEEKDVSKGHMSGTKTRDKTAFQNAHIQVDGTTRYEAPNGHTKMLGVELDTDKLEVIGDLILEGAVGSTKWASDMSGWCLFCGGNIFSYDSDKRTKVQDEVYKNVVNIRDGKNSFIDGNLNLRGSVLDIYEGNLKVSGNVLSGDVKRCFQNEIEQGNFGIGFKGTIDWREVSVGFHLGGGESWFKEKGCDAVVSTIRSAGGARLQAGGHSKHFGTEIERVSLGGTNVTLAAAEETYELEHGGWDWSVGVVAGLQSSIADLYDRSQDIGRHMEQGGKVGAMNLGFDAIHTAADIAKFIENPGRVGLWAQAAAHNKNKRVKKLKHKCPTLVSDGQGIVADTVTLQCLQAHGSEFGIKARRLESISAEDKEETTYHEEGGKIEVAIPGVSIGGPVSGDVNFQVNSTEQTTQQTSHLAFDKIVLDIDEDAVLEGMRIVAKQVDAQFGALILASVTNRIKSNGFHVEAGVSVSEASSGLNTLLNGGVGGKGAEAIWAAEMSAILGTESVKLVVKDAIEMTGAMIANAEFDPVTKKYTDLGNMAIKAGKIIEHKLKTLNENLGVDLGAGGGGGSASIPIFGTASFGGKKTMGEVKSALGQMHWVDPDYDGSDDEYEEIIEFDENGIECRRAPGELCYFGNRDLNDVELSESVWEIPQVDAYLAWFNPKKIGGDVKLRLNQIGEFFAELNALRAKRPLDSRGEARAKRDAQAKYDASIRSAERLRDEARARDDAETEARAEAIKKHYEKAQEHNEQISKDLAMLESERSSLSGEQEKKLKKAILTQQELEAFERSLGDFTSAFEGNTNDLASAQLLAMLSGAEAHYKYLVDSDLSSTADRLQKNVLEQTYVAMTKGDYERAERILSFSMIYDADHYGNPNLPKWLNDIRQGFAEGARESALSTDDAFAAFWNDPSAAAKGLLNVIAHPMEASEALVEAFGDKWNEFAEGTPKERARMAGSLFGEAAQSMVVPGCALGKLGKVGRGLGTAEKAAAKAGAKAHKYFPAPKTLEAFPDAVKVKEKTLLKGSGKRKRWRDTKGHIFEWDYQHGAVEKYSKNGRSHLGEYDATTGAQTKPAMGHRRQVEK